MEEYEEFEESLYVERVVGVQPFQFEPEFRPFTTEGRSECENSMTDTSDEDSFSEEEAVDHEFGTNNRLGNTDWCTCGRCVVMDTEMESICCQEIQGFQHGLTEVEVKCVVDHPGFSANCTNRWVLESAFHEFVQEQGPIRDEEPLHELYRYIAYKRLSRFIYFRLPKYDRRIHPSCAVKTIRLAFPSDGYTGFLFA